MQKQWGHSLPGTYTLMAHCLFEEETMSSIMFQWLHGNWLHPRLQMLPRSQRPGVTSHTPLRHTVGETGALSVRSHSSEAKKEACWTQEAV